jgi:hypothetical protein
LLEVNAAKYCWEQYKARVLDTVLGTVQSCIALCNYT